MSDPEQRPLQHLDSLRLGHIAEVPGATGVLTICCDRNRRPHEDATVFERNAIAGTDLVRVLVEIVDLFDEAVPLRDLFSGVGEKLLIVRARCDFFRDSPQLEKSAVV